MIVESCKFNSKQDNHDVDQFGYINLAESLENGVVPSEIADSEPSYNEIDDPSTIIGKPRDVFHYRIMHLKQVKRIQVQILLSSNLLFLYST